MYNHVDAVYQCINYGLEHDLRIPYNISITFVTRDICCIYQRPRVRQQAKKSESVTICSKARVTAFNQLGIFLKIAAVQETLVWETRSLRPSSFTSLLMKQVLKTI